jgi:hypothetical protein
LSGNQSVSVVDALRAPYHDFVPRFFSRDCLGSRYHGGECGERPCGVHSARPFQPRSSADPFAKPKDQQQQCLRFTLCLSPTHSVQEGKCISASDCQEPVPASQCNHVHPASGRPLIRTVVRHLHARQAVRVNDRLRLVLFRKEAISKHISNLLFAKNGDGQRTAIRITTTRS